MTADTDREAAPDPRPDTTKTDGREGEPLGDGTLTPQERAVQAMIDAEDDTVVVRGLD